ncbi:MAG TPA: hypothetical protein VGO34_11280 [Alphaproteobacteria bacterium]
MAEEDTDIVFAQSRVPTIYSDGALNCAFNKSIMKIHFARSNPAVGPASGTTTELCAQIVMPIDGFLSSFVFFQNHIKRMLKDGLIKQADLDSLQTAFDDPS